MAIETSIQGLLHTFEQGRAAVWLHRALIASIVGAVAATWMFAKFNGFSTSEAMDQAQIGRQLAAGHGYTTLYARPLALHLMLARTGELRQPLPDISQAPLGPLLNAATLKISGAPFTFPEREVVSPAERAIVFTGFLLLAGALILSYLLGRRLFGPRLAILGTGLVIATDLMWRFTFSGLPQIAMLFFFSGALLALVAAMDAQDARHGTRCVLLVLLAALLLGLVTLGNGLGLWIFAGFWLFSVAAIRPRWLVALAAPVIYLLPLAPWALHNWRFLRHPFGESIYQLYRTPGTDRLSLTADFEPVLRLRWEDFLQNTAENFITQAAAFPSYLGFNIVAAAFFLAVLLHTFRRWQPAQFRWAVLAMWGGAAAGMVAFGVGDAVSANQLHILFLPVMTFYGLSFLLILWNRLEFDQPVLRAAFIVLLFALVSARLFITMFTDPGRVNWPPYLPPLVERFSQWVEPDEAMASDIPWATAWYAGRQSLLLPESIEQFELIHAERLLGAPLVAMYLTPFSGNRPTYGEIINGRYREWARFVLREVREEDLREWMLGSAVNLPVDGEAIFFADRARWR
jgi:hypothetical protein